MYTIYVFFVHVHIIMPDPHMLTRHGSIKFVLEVVFVDGVSAAVCVLACVC